MEWIRQIKLSDELIEKIKSYSTVKTFSLKSPLFYEGQIPIVAYLILKGNIQLSKKKKVQHTLKSGTLLGSNEVINKIPCDFTAEALNNTTVCFIDRSTLLEMHEGTNQELSPLLKVDKEEA